MANRQNLLKIAERYERENAEAARIVRETADPDDCMSLLVQWAHRVEARQAEDAALGRGAAKARVMRRSGGAK